MPSSATFYVTDEISSRKILKEVVEYKQIMGVHTSLSAVLAVALKERTETKTI
jgi:hypothetical protein